MEKQELIAKSKEVFEYHKNAKKVIATGDGNFFLPEALNLANDHARRNGVQVFEIARGDAFVELSTTGEQNPRHEADKKGIAELNLKNLDLTQPVDYNVLKALAEDLELVLENKKAATILAALIEYKSKLES